MITNCRLLVLLGFLLRAGTVDVLLAQVPATAPEELLQLVDPVVRYRPIPLSKEDDAYGVLVELQKLKVVESSVSEDRELDDAYLDIIGGDLPFPDDELGRRLSQLINDNAEGLKLFDQFAQFRGVRFPDLLKATGSELRQFSRIRLLQIAQDQAQKKFEKATQRLFELLHIADMLQDSEGGLLTWLTGYGLRASTLEFMTRLAADPACSIEQLESWQRRVIDLRKLSTQSLAQSLRRNYFEIQLPPLAKLPPDATLEQAVEATIGVHRPPPERVAVNLRLTLRKWQVLVLLGDHPTPFDRDETIRLSSQQLADVIRVLDFDRSTPQDFDNEEILRVAELWPASIGLDAFSVLFLQLGRQSWESWEEFWNDIVSAAEAGEQLSEIPNAFGKYWISLHSELATADSLAGTIVRRRARTEATIATFAIRRFERLHQRLPKTLQEVVDAKFLIEIPRDPIDGQPLRYDPARRLLWSIGLDGHDDGGVQNYGSSEKLFSMLRKLLPKQHSDKLSKPPAPPPNPDHEGSDVVYRLDVEQRRRTPK